MATPAEHLILRGLHLIIRASFSPNDPVVQAKHFASLTQDIAPWLKDYADEIAKPAHARTADYESRASGLEVRDTKPNGQDKTD
jgi:hypothetical protein